MEIPYKSLRKELLVEILKEIVTRDGTDYGENEKSIDAKISTALRSLEQGRSCLFWNPESETASLHPIDSKPS